MALRIPSQGGLNGLVREGQRSMQGPEEVVFRNLDACRELAALVSTSLGPHGLHKLVANHLEKLFVANDGGTILRELEVEHPAAKLLVVAAGQQARERGDGTTLTVTLAGELLAAAEGLLRLGLKPSVIVEGYEAAYGMLKAFVDEGLEKTSMVPTTMLPLPESVLGSKVAGQEKTLAPLVLEAALAVLPADPTHFSVDQIHIVKGVGCGGAAVVRGTVLAREPETRRQRAVEAKVAVFSCPLAVGTTETKGTVVLHNAAEMTAFAADEERGIEESVRAIADSGVKVLVAHGTISDIVLHHLDRHDLLALRVTSKFDLRRVCRATGSVPLARLGAPMAEEAGYVDVVETIELGGETRGTVLRQEGTDASRTATIVLRGMTVGAVEETERALGSAIAAVRQVCLDGTVVAGRGVSEDAIGREIGARASRITDIEQLPVRAFAEAFRAIARRIARDAEDSSVRVYDHLDTKKSTIALAVDAVLTILRVDQIIMSKPAGGPKPPSQARRDADD